VILAYFGSEPEEPEHPFMKQAMIYNDRYRAIIARLVKARTVTGLTQEELALQLGINQPDVSRIENFDRQLTLIEMLDWIQATDAQDLDCIVKALEDTNAQG
jgi:predicted transcriptional regulator